MKQSRVVQSAKKAIDDVFSDTTVPAEETLDRLMDIKDEIDMKIDAIESDLKKGRT